MTTRATRRCARRVLAALAVATVAGCSESGNEGLAPIHGQPESTWRVELDGIAPVGYPVGSHLVVIVVNTDDEGGGGRLVVLDAGSGEVEWERPLPAGSRLPLPAGDDDLLVQDVRTARLLDVDSGAERWIMDVRPGHYVAAVSDTLLATTSQSVDGPDGRSTFEWTAIDMGTGVQGTTVEADRASAFDRDVAVLADGAVTIHDAMTLDAIGEPIAVDGALGIVLTDDELWVTYEDHVEVRERAGAVVASGPTTEPSWDVSEIGADRVLVGDSGSTTELLERRGAELVPVWRGRGDRALQDPRDATRYVVLREANRVSVVDLLAEEPEPAVIELAAEVEFSVRFDARITDGQIYVLDGEDHITGHRLDDAREVWRLDRPRSSHLIALDGAVVVMGWHTRASIERYD